MKSALLPLIQSLRSQPNALLGLKITKNCLLVAKRKVKTRGQTKLNLLYPKARKFSHIILFIAKRNNQAFLLSKLARGKYQMNRTTLLRHSSLDLWRKSWQCSSKETINKISNNDRRQPKWAYLVRKTILQH